MELIYFSDVSQVDYVINFQPNLLWQMRPITGNITVAFELEKRGIEFIDVWDFINAEEIEKNWNDAYQISRAWWDECIASAEYGGVQLSAMAQQDIVYPFEASLNARTGYYKIFHKYPIERINGFFLPSVGVVRTGPVPSSRAVYSISEAILFYIAEQLKIPIVKLNSTLPLSSGSLTYRGRWLNTLDTTKFTKVDNFEGKIILVYKTGIPASEYADLMVAIEKLSGVKIISITQDILETGSQFTGMQSNTESRLQPFWHKFVESVKNYQGDYPEIFSNKHLQFQFERIKIEMESASTYGDVFNTFLDTLKPSLIIFGHEAFTIERVLVNLAQNKKIPTVSLIHGGVRFKFGSRGIIGDVDAVMAWSEKDIEWLTSYGIDKFRLNKIGCFRYEKHYLNYTNNKSINSHQIKIAAKKHLRISPNKPLIVLVTAEINTGFSAPVAEPRKHRETIKSFLSLVESRPDLQFIIKAHPSNDYHEFYRRLISPKCPNLMFFEQATLSEIMEASDICLMINYCTTASLEAMLNKVPVIYLNNAIYRLNDWRDNLSESGILYIGSFIELEKTIDNLLTSPEKKQNLLVEADKKLKEILGLEENTKASQRFVDFIRCVLDGEQIANTQVMRDLLCAKDLNQSNIKLSELTGAHTGENLMYVFTYFAGLNNLELANLKRIFEMFHKYVNNEELMSWHKAERLLLPIFITGNLNSNRNNLATIWLLSRYLVNPHNFFSASASFKTRLYIHLAISVLGRNNTIKLLQAIDAKRLSL